MQSMFENPKAVNWSLKVEPQEVQSDVSQGLSTKGVLTVVTPPVITICLSSIWNFLGEPARLTSLMETATGKEEMTELLPTLSSMAWVYSMDRFCSIEDIWLQRKQMKKPMITSERLPPAMVSQQGCFRVRKLADVQRKSILMMVLLRKFFRPMFKKQTTRIETIFCHLPFPATNTPAVPDIQTYAALHPRNHWPRLHQIPSLEGGCRLANLQFVVTIGHQKYHRFGPPSVYNSNKPVILLDQISHSCTFFGDVRSECGSQLSECKEGND